MLIVEDASDCLFVVVTVIVSRAVERLIF